MSSSTISGSTSTPAVSSPGIGSGLDVTGIVSKLMAIQALPLTAMENKVTGYQNQISAWGTLQSVYSSLGSTMSTLETPSTFQNMTASVADTTVASAAAVPGAQAGNYSLTVNTLAQAQSIASADIPATTSTVGSGTLTIQLGSYKSDGSFTPSTTQAAQTITIPSTNDSLAGIASAINAAGAGVSANVVNDGTGYRLVITSASGTSNAMKITVADDDGNNTDHSGLSQLAYDASTGGTQNMSQTVAASDATLSVNGIDITSATNSITTAIQGVTLNLAGEGTTTLSVSQNTSAITTAVNNFVSAWNSVNSAVTQADNYDSTTQTASVLQGNTTLLSVQTELRNLVNTPLTPAVGGLSYLSDIGISFQLDGSLQLDTSTLQSVLSDPSKNIAALFANQGAATDSQISFASAVGSPTPGTYAVNITQLATQASSTGSTAAGLTITSNVNDVLSVNVDGTNVSVIIPAGTYTASSMAAELQSLINSNSDVSANGSSVSVTQSNGVLTMTSTKFGSTSQASIISGDAAAGLFGTPTNAAGLDVAGSIGGVTATGSGQFLGSNGLTIKVTGGSTGDRGTVSYAQGFATQIDNLMSSVAGSTGQIQDVEDGLNTSVTSIKTDMTNLQTQLETEQATLMAQFNALDSLLSSMQSTQSYLTSELTSLPYTTSTTNAANNSK